MKRTPKWSNSSSAASKWRVLRAKRSNFQTRTQSISWFRAKPWRDSHHVMAFLLRQGHEVTPVNPHLVGQTVHARVVVPDLAAAAPLDMVDVFRPAAECLEIAARLAKTFD